MAYLSITGHGAFRMQQRRISEAEIYEVMDNLPNVHQGRKPHQRVYVGITEGGRRLKIVLAHDEDPPVLVTVVAPDE